MSRAKHPSQYSMQIMGLMKCKEVKYNPCRTPEDVWNICHNQANLAQEAFVVICLNSKNNVIDVHLCTLGILDASLVAPREVFSIAVKDTAAAIVLVHNHPSGDPAPSAEDIRITRQIVEAGQIMQIPLIDHIILGNQNNKEMKKLFSMREEGVVDFRGNI